MYIFTFQKIPTKIACFFIQTLYKSPRCSKQKSFMWPEIQRKKNEAEILDPIPPVQPQSTCFAGIKDHFNVSHTEILKETTRKVDTSHILSMQRLTLRKCDSQKLLSAKKQILFSRGSRSGPSQPFPTIPGCAGVKGPKPRLLRKNTWLSYPSDPPKKTGKQWEQMALQSLKVC